MSDFDRIQRLRAKFLAERRDRALGDYWRDQRDLAAYDEVLAARIGWKWDAALRECQDRGFGRDDSAVVLDFGCGTGIAARRFVEHFGAAEVLCHDRSPHAMSFAVRRIAEAHPTVPVRAVADVRDLEPDVLLISHVLTELDAGAEARLERWIAQSRRVVVVESGTRAAGRRLAQLRDRLRDRLHVIAPCPHRESCPALLNDRDWCHFFATPPAHVFTDGVWVRLGRELGIDLRSLPYSFVAMSREPLAAAPAPAPAPRPLGRARVSRHTAEVDVCVAGRLERLTIHKRTDPATWRTLKKAPERLRGLRLDVPGSSSSA